MICQFRECENIATRQLTWWIPAGPYPYPIHVYKSSEARVTICNEHEKENKEYEKTLPKGWEREEIPVDESWGEYNF